MGVLALAVLAAVPSLGASGAATMAASPDLVGGVVEPPELFGDGFESGDTSAWSATVPDPTSTFSVGGEVTGLAGSGLVLQINGGDDLTITANGTFIFPTALVDTSAYSVTVLTQPTSPSQTCVVTGGSGTVAGADVVDVTVICTTHRYTVGGTVNGLAGSGLVLQNNGGDDLAISVDGEFTFGTTIDDGSPYAVTVLTQPTSSSQTCVVGNGSGTVAGADVTNVTVSCTIDQFTVGGTATDLAGSGLVLRNNGGDDLAVTSSGSFTFATLLDDGSTYSVTVWQQPTDPGQTCSVMAGGSGTIAGADVTTVSVQCVTHTYSIGGVLSGLEGTSVALANNVTDTLLLNTDGPFQFLGPVADGGSYDVVVVGQPTNPAQTCTVTNGSGTVSGGDVTDVEVDCVVRSFTIGGTVAGLEGSGLVLRNNGSDDLTVSGNGSFTFATPVLDLNPYAVTILSQPGSPEQLCSVSNGSGTVSGGDVTSVMIDCVTYYTIGGDVTGLVGSDLVLQNNGGDSLPITTSGPFTFATPLLDGSSYRVTVLSQPSPTELCQLENEAGTLAGSNVTNVAVTCTAGLDSYGPVEPLYPANGPDWLDYVDNDGTSEFGASDTACPGTGSGYTSCIHGGEKRSLTLTGVSSCAGITAYDSLGAFDWTCDDSSSTATLLSVGLKDGIGLADLIDYTGPAWAPNAVTVFSSGTPIGLSSGTVWWGNTVSAANDTDGDHSENLTTAGIYVVTQDTYAWYQLNADKVGLVIEPGRTVSCPSGSAVLAWNDYDWFEGDVDGGSCSTVVDGNSGGLYQVFRNVTVTNSGSNSSQVRSAGDNARLKGVTAVDSGRWGIMLSGQGLLAEDIASMASGGDGITLDALDDSVLRGVVSLYSGNNGILIKGSSSGNLITDVVTTHNDGPGLWLFPAMDNEFLRVFATENRTAGLNVSSGSTGNRFREIVCANNDDGIRLGGIQNQLIDAVAASSEFTNITLGTGSDNIAINVLAVNSYISGVADAVDVYSNNSVLRNVAAVNAQRAGLTVVADDSVYENVVAAHNGQRGVWLSSASTGNNFTGHLKVGANAGQDCYVESETASTALIDDTPPPSNFVHEGLCIEGPTSTFGTATYGVSLSASFIGKVFVDDSTNADDVDGAAPYDAIVDWWNFDNRYRHWGLDGSAFPAADHRDRCRTGDDCRIWDWRLALGDSGDGGAPVLLGVNPFPTGNDTITHTWSDGSSETFLRNAVEIDDDGFGDDDLLCESFEACLYTPNIGAYQGHGALVWAGAFTPGVLSGIVLYRYELNGY